jgi:hypothetical protein
MLHPKAKSRLFGITATKYRKLTGTARNNAKEEAVTHMEEHYEELFQRRHDCIHNCDRPKLALQNITLKQVQKAIDDIHFLVGRCQDAFIAEFPTYLTGLGFKGATKNRVCQ